MDEQFELPIVRYKIGLDPLLGLFPGGGDWVAWVAAVYIFWVAVSLQVPNRLLLGMAANIVVDLVVGYVPAAGDLFDAVFKANRKNVDLLFDHFQVRGSRDQPTRLPDESGGKLGRYLLGGGLVLFLAAVAILPVVILWWLFAG